MERGKVRAFTENFIKHVSANLCIMTCFDICTRKFINILYRMRTQEMMMKHALTVPVDLYSWNANMMLYEGVYNISFMNNMADWKPYCKKLYDIGPLSRLLYQKVYKGALQYEAEFLHTNMWSLTRRQMTTVMSGDNVAERRGIL